MVQVTDIRETTLGKRVTINSRIYYLGLEPVRIYNLMLMLSKLNSLKLDYKTAVEFCAVRKMEIIAFDTNIEMNERRFVSKDYLAPELMINDEDDC